MCVVLASPYMMGGLHCEGSPRPGQAEVRALCCVDLVAIRRGLLGVEVLNELTDTPSTPAEVAKLCWVPACGWKEETHSRMN